MSTTITTQPKKIQAVTLSVLTGRVNVHFEDELDAVYTPVDPDEYPGGYDPSDSSLNPVPYYSVHGSLMAMLMHAKANNLSVSVKWRPPERQSTAGDYKIRDALRFTVESRDTGLVPWSDREPA